ncbi:MAG: 16S rRNA (adenine(1518)-N(6)/adenine(1519)-N(6))-dimethyltransferase RsmA [Betaproteobacteria bacterium]|nr:16S rRNA (adenine(1518)-N(6)/adenine(1519)-N(6))-dimethyltransferase RsmA [Betaproteobacteria bacterium]MDE2423159.1 16S rRNA (adenine(1518)-N(6)/adenine(1519)-N(6))-dimethyltransferase RsmA [Betaproteobacteria bacterium]
MTKHIPRKRFGQHFLIDQSIIRHILQVANLKKQDNVIEIGPGLGALTHPLLEVLDRLTIVELDRDLISYWQKQTDYSNRLSIVEGDVLKVDFNQFAKGFRLFGNLPYNISTPLLFHLNHSATLWHDAHFMLQKEVIDRLTALPNSSDYGRLTVMMSYRYYIEHLFDVPPESFDPPPKVMSAIVRLIPKPASLLTAKNESHFAKLVMAAFSQKRKMLRSTLKNWINAEQWSELSINPERRAETLSLEEFVRLSNYLSDIS